MASPIRTDASDRDTQAQAGGSSVSGETSNQAGGHQPLLVSPTPEVESDPTRLGQLLPFLYPSGPALCVARPLCRRPSVGLAHEAARQPPPETCDDSATAEAGPSDPQGLARGANRAVPPCQPPGREVPAGLDAHSCVRDGCRRAGCITKGACPVRRAGVRNRRWQHCHGADARPLPYIPTWAGFLYLAVVLDAFSRKIVGWAMETHLRTELVLAALNIALGQRRPRGVIHHSDHGSQGRFKRSSQHKVLAHRKILV